MARILSSLIGAAVAFLFLAVFIIAFVPDPGVRGLLLLGAAVGAFVWAYGKTGKHE